MKGRLVLLTGFGAFEEVRDNPSGALARTLDGEPVGEGRIVGRVLPVSFRRAPLEVELEVQRARPAAIVATGVHRGSDFRVERGAGVELRGGRPDADGEGAEGMPARSGERLETVLDVERLAAALGGGSAAPVTVSDDAGGYVCECTYRRVLEIADRSGTAGVFVHVPSPEAVDLGRQRAGLRALVADVLEQLAAGRTSGA